jgi:hypothetical protein
MQASDIPTKMPTPFASSAPGGDITYPLPVASQPSGHASFTDGFPPSNFVDPLAGGVPPWGADMNGLEKQATSWDRWYQAGGPIAYDATFQAAIGGYPAGARVLSATTAGLVWVSMTDNNVTNPDAAGAGWVQSGSTVVRQLTGTGLTNVTVPTYAVGAFIEGWGGGGGSSGSSGVGLNVGGSGGGGGYAAGWFSVSGGQTLACTVPTGGSAAVNGNQAGGGGTMTVVRSAVTLIAATGGAGANTGGANGGAGTVGQILVPGQAGGDLDGLIQPPGSAGTAMTVVGGASRRLRRDGQRCRGAPPGDAARWRRRRQLLR